MVTLEYKLKPDNHKDRLQILVELSDNVTKVYKKYEEREKDLKNKNMSIEEGGLGKEFVNVWAKFNTEKGQLTQMCNQFSRSISLMNQGNSFTQAMFGIKTNTKDLDITAQWAICRGQANNPTQIYFISTPPGQKIGFFPKQTMAFDHVMSYTKVNVDKILRDLILKNPNTRDDMFIYNLVTGDERIPIYSKILHPEAGRFEVKVKEDNGSIQVVQEEEE